MSPALLIATGLQDHMELLQKLRPTCLQNIGDKAIIIHIIEALNRLGVTQFEIVLHHYPEAVESALGDGSRWGVHINYHLCINPKDPFKATIPILYRYPQTHLILGTGDTLPLFPASFLNTLNTFYIEKSEEWSGWAITSTEFLQAHLHQAPFPPPSANKTTIDIQFSTRTAAELLSSNLAILTDPNATTLMPSSAHQAEPHLWISRGAIIHPTAKLHPPLFIGMNAQIKAHVTLGPHAVIERRSLIDEHSIVQDSLICRDSYVGETLNVQHSIIDRNLLANIEHNTIISIQDDLIIGELAPPSPTRWIFRILGRLIAALALLVLSPLFLLLWLIKPIINRYYLSLPIRNEHQAKAFNWPAFQFKGKNFFSHLLRELPSLLPLARGELHWVGVTARSKEEIDMLPSYWKKLYFHSKVGMITLADLDHGPEASEDERYASDAYYAVHSSVGLDLKLIFRKLLSPIYKLFKRT